MLKALNMDLIRYKANSGAVWCLLFVSTSLKNSPEQVDAELKISLIMNGNMKILFKVILNLEKG